MLCTVLESENNSHTCRPHSLFKKEKNIFNYLLAGTHFQSYFPLLLWYISMENLYILERNKNKFKESFDILRQGRSNT